MIAVIDYGAGNLRSVVNAINHLGHEASVTSSAGDIMSAQAVFLPGVGAAGDTMAGLKKVDLIRTIHRLIDENRPLFGICIGLQVLFSGTDEGGRQECLNIVPGWVRKLPAGQKIPHMGWNQVRQKRQHPLFEGVADGTDFYFVHSYYGSPDDKSLVLAETEYGLSFCSALARGNLIATQFHPEKSGDMGLRLYSNFLRMAGAA
ncbi:MAG: imidazole glycerol phosphate synthase subunit HisH [Dehalococcoidales bacterium]|nr:imidazole glycerol phosphate synthase subunit HisH [Dehalococcoidales bacterium]